MINSIILPSLDNLKQQAKRLRQALDKQGTVIGHSKALEAIAAQHGYKDWNTLFAALGNQSPAHPVTVGEQVSGKYLGQHFVGEITSVQSLNAGERFRITINFDEAVDVVSFDSFSAFRKRVSCTIDKMGKTFEKTSNGLPQLEFH